MTKSEISFFTALYGGDYSDNVKFRQLVKDFMEDVSDPMGLILGDPYILVTDYHFPFRYFYSRGIQTFQTETFDEYLELVYAGMYSILEGAENSGDTWMNVHYFTVRLLKLFPDMTIDFMESVIDYVNQTKDADHKFFYDGEKIGLQKNHNMELFIANKVTGLLKEPSCSTSDFQYEPSDHLCDEQNEAIDAVMKTDFSILTGGPGTGKTTTINYILSEYRKQYERKEIVLLAPTGKAAKRMDVCTGGEYMPTTIHYLALKEHFNHDNENPDIIDFCVIDEGSMIPLDIFYELMRYVRIKKLLIVGDIDQLESVSCGDILHDLIDLHVPTKRLLENHRSGDAIVENARKIKMGFLSLHTSESFKIYEASDDEIGDLVLSEYDRDTTMVLCPTREMTRQMNQRIKSFLYPDSDPRYYTCGDRVLFTRNNRKKGYVNGDTGTVETILADGMRVEIDSDVSNVSENTISVRGKMFDDVELGYALTIHKSQGSEYDKVVLCIPKGTGRLFSRNLLYTAVTRARNEVVIIGSIEDLKKIIAKNPRRRQTFLKSFSETEQIA